MKYLFTGVLALFGMVLVVNMNDAQDKAKFTISEVMKKAMKGGLCGKVASGKASDEEKMQLVELFTALAANPCPKGDAKSWKSKTDALVSAAKSADGKALKAAANCGACHKAHKG